MAREIALCYAVVKAHCYALSVYSEKMDSPADRLKKARVDAGYSTAAEAARAHRFHPQNLRDHEAGRRTIHEDHARAYGKAFKVPWLWILHNIQPDDVIAPQNSTKAPAIVMKPVVGTVQGGAWQEIVEIDENRVASLPIPGSLHKEGARQFWLEIVGDSVDLYVRAGGHVLCTDVWDWARDTEDLFTRAANKLVIVQRWRGDLFERTCKVLKVEDGKAYLEAASSNSRWMNEPRIPLNENGDVDSVELIAVVEWIGVPAP